MATNVEIDPELIKAALSLGGQRSKRAVIDEALREYVLRRRQRGVIELFGTIDYDDGYNYKKQRARRPSSSMPVAKAGFKVRTLIS